MTRTRARLPVGGVALAASAAALFSVLAARIEAVVAGQTLVVGLPWIPTLGARLSFHLDGLSLLFALLVTGIGAVVFLYAGAYLRGEARLGQFYAALALFAAAMLGVVLADNVILLFVCWELTSLASYVLIGFRHERAAAREAALQALLVTGLGGLALLGGLLLLAAMAGSTELSAIVRAGAAVRADARYPAALGLVLVGAFTKSAQVPFHFWLPAAMEAPTPVSAYLHAATMVKAGVYLLARLAPALGGTALWQVSVTAGGAATAVAGAVLALGTTDLKRILACTTVSALGVLVMLLGAGSPAAVAAAVVVLLAHALYKGALFLGAGSIEHGTGSRDVSALGGLGASMPATAVVMGVAALGLAGMGPVLSFVGKEMAFEALLAGGAASGLQMVAVAALWASAAAGVALAGVVFLRPFFGSPGAGVTPGVGAPLPVEPTGAEGERSEGAPSDWAEGERSGGAPPDWTEARGSGAPPPEWAEGEGSGGAPPDWTEARGSGAPPPERADAKRARAPRPDRAETGDQTTHEAPWAMTAGPLLLAVLGVVFGIQPALVYALVAPAAASVAGRPVPVDLALWHGLSPSLAASAAAVVVGVGIYLGWPRVRAVAAPARWWGPARWYDAGLRLLAWTADRQTRLLQSGYLRLYLLLIMVASGGAAWLALARGAAGIVAPAGVATLPGATSSVPASSAQTLSVSTSPASTSSVSTSSVPGWADVYLADVHLYEVVVAGLILAGALVAAASRSRLGAVAALGVVGAGVSLIYALFGAPDLAMTQILVEALTVLLFVLAFYHLPRFARLSSRPARVRDALAAGVVGTLAAVLVLMAAGAPKGRQVARYYAEQSLPAAHGRNVVNVILVDFRGLDTLGEITVLATAAMGVYVMLRLRGSEGRGGAGGAGGAGGVGGAGG
ncbi:MAG: proton-conducting transporter membrane subunit [Armatimonadota bacterium]|nr:proton-conducting transporter membrane subunit [Armatimonadota bacterium]